MVNHVLKHTPTKTINLANLIFSLKNNTYICLSFCNVEFTNMDETIQQEGIIKRIEQGVAYVEILQTSACAGCHAKASCNSSECKTRIIEVSDFTNSFSENEKVFLLSKSSLGYQAVFYAFVIPFILLFIIIIICLELNLGEPLSALAGIAVLPFYYSALYFFKDKLKKRFAFTIKKHF
jgi:Positive regulator of sigma E activity